MDYNTDRQDRNARLMMGFIALIVGLAIIYSRFAPPAPQQPAYYRPDPTPFVVETQHTDIFSHNQLCVGINVCN